MDEWCVGCDVVRSLRLLVSDERTERDRPVVVHVDAVESGDGADVDDVAGAPHPESHQRDQALPTGEDLRLVAVFVEEGQRRLERLGPVVCERRCFHRDIVLVDATPGQTTARCMASVCGCVRGQTPSVSFVDTFGV